MEILFCGGCNSLYNRMTVYHKMKNRQLEGIDFLILNGCHRGCRKVAMKPKTINVQEFFTTRSSEEWREEKIIEWILSRA